MWSGGLAKNKGIMNFHIIPEPKRKRKAQSSDDDDDDEFYDRTTEAEEKRKRKAAAEENAALSYDQLVGFIGFTIIKYPTITFALGFRILRSMKRRKL